MGQSSSRRASESKNSNRQPKTSSEAVKAAAVQAVMEMLEDRAMLSLAMLAGGAFGSSAASGHGSDQAIDGYTSTYFEASSANGGYTGIDLGSGLAKPISEVRFAPRSGYESRMNGGKFQGSDTSPSSGFTDLYTISSTPSSGWTQANVADSTSYRYLRYLSPNGGYGDVGEIQFYSDSAWPSGWSSNDINNPTEPGSATSSSDGTSWTIRGGGFSSWIEADSYNYSELIEYQFVHQSLIGDSAIEAKVESFTDTDYYGKAGVVYRDPSSGAYVALLVMPNEILFTIDGNVLGEVYPASAPQYLKLERSEGYFTASYSDDGSSWSQVGDSAEDYLPTTAQVGLGVTGWLGLATASFSQVSVQGDVLLPPAAPSSLLATATSGSSMSLSWVDNSSNESGFEIDYATNADFSNQSSKTVAADTISDLLTGLSGSTVYYVRIRALNTTTGPSAYSTSASCTTLPAGWTSSNVGIVSVTGDGPAYDASTQTWTIKGGGWDIWDDEAEQYRFAYQSVNGDAAIVARVDSLENTSNWAKAGVMLRDGTSTGAPYAALVVTPGAGLMFTVRPEEGLDSAQVATVSNVTAPQWLKLVRSGNQISAFCSTDGQNWTSVGSPQTVGLGNSALAGLAVAAHSSGVNSSVFSNVSVNEATAQTPAAPTALRVPAASSSQIQLAWVDNSSNEDGFVVECASDSTFSTVSMTGTVAADVTSYVFTGLSETTTYYFRVRATNSTLGDSNNSAALSAATLISPWSSTDIGPVSHAGVGASYDEVADTWTINAAGWDIWDDGAEQYRFTYLSVSGDVTIVAHVDSLQSTSNWAKAGVMLRDGTSTGAAYAALVVTPGEGVMFTVRESAEYDPIQVAEDSLVTIPRWLKLVRSVDAISALYSADGQDWTPVGTSQSVNLGTIAQAGIAVATHNSGLSTAVFSSVSTSGGIVTPPAAPEDLSATVVSAARIDLSWTDDSDNEQGFKIEYSTDSSFPAASTTTVTIATTNVTSRSITGLSATTTYYFRVKATHSTTGDSNWSNTASAITDGTALPAPWISTDIDSPEPSGSASYNSATEVWQIQGGGFGDWIDWENSDYWTMSPFQFVHQTVVDDASIEAEVQELDSTHYNARAGIMFRDPASGSYVALVVMPGGLLFSSDGTVIREESVTAPQYLRLERSGDTFTASYSPDGSSWTAIEDTIDVSLSSAAQVGLVTTGWWNELATASFAHVAVNGSGPGPEIEASVNSSNLADGGTVDFGAVTSGSPVTKTFTIHNTGEQNLTLGTLSTMPGGFTLVSDIGDSDLAPGEQTTFTIRLDATTSGSFGGNVSLSTNDSDENPFHFELDGLVDAWIIDDGDAGYSSTGFTPYTGQGYQNDVREGHNASQQATWTLSGLSPGQYRVSVTWTSWTNRAADAPFTVLDGFTVLGTARVNQQAPADDCSDHGVGWKDLGVYEILGNTLNVRLTGDANGNVIADAVRVLRVDGAVQTPPAAPSNLATTAVGTHQINLTWADNSTFERGFEIDYSTDSGFAAASTTTVTISTASTTNYSVTGLLEGTTYYFRVRATHPVVGASAWSNTASAITDTSTLPAPWVSSDVDDPTPTGSASYNVDTDAFRITGGGYEDFMFSGDSGCEFGPAHRVYQSVGGDASIVAQLTSYQEDTPAWGRAALAFGNTTIGNAFVALVYSSSANVGYLTLMASSGSGSGSAYFSNSVAVIGTPWLKLEREGDFFQASYSTDGESWTEIDQPWEWDAGAATDVGMAVTGWVGQATAAFAHVGVAQPIRIAMSGPATVDEGLQYTLNLTVDGSRAADFQQLLIDWDDGLPSQTVEATQTTVTHVFDDGPRAASIVVSAVGASQYVSNSLPVTVTNVAPTATFSHGGLSGADTSITLSFTGASDPSTADETAGFLYSYDFNGDGRWEVVDSSLASVEVAGTNFPGNGTYIVGGRITDRNGGFSDYTLLVSTAGGSTVDDIHPGSLPSDPQDLTDVNGTLFFTADDGVHGRELWKSDGTLAGTVLVKDIADGDDGSAPDGLVNVNGLLFFVADDGVHGSELWASDGTEGGTLLVKDIVSGSGGSSLASLTNVSGTVFFVADDAVHGAELWKSDGTAAGTTLVSDIAATGGSDPHELVGLGTTAYFAAQSNAADGMQLWKSDGTSAGTILVKQINVAGSANPRYLTILDGNLLFAADDGSTGVELWKSDGTSAGTVLVKDILDGTDGSAPDQLTVVNGTLFLTADDGSSGRELWKTDGTAAGTVLVKDILDGAEGSTPGVLTAVDNQLLFAASDGVNGRELWRSDGTANGTTMVTDIAPSGDADPSGLLNVNGMLFFAANDGTTGVELWRSDGTAGGTAQVKDIRQGSDSSDPQWLTLSGGIVYFTADDGISGRELWALRAPTAAAGDYEVEEGAPFSLVLSGAASFDPNPSESLSYAWDLDGDGLFGETGSAATRGDETGINPTFSTASVDGPVMIPVALRVANSSGMSSSISSGIISVVNRPPSILVSGGGTVVEGGDYAISFSVTGDIPQDTVTNWSVDWGDGAIDTINSTGSGTASHVYADGPMPYTITVTGTDEDGSYLSAPHNVNVTNVAPTIQVTDDGSTITEDEAYSLHLLRTSDPGQDMMHWLVDWGDGSPTQLLGGNRIDAAHVYTVADAAGQSYTVSVTPSDEDGTYAAVTRQVTVDLAVPANPWDLVATVAAGDDRVHLDWSDRSDNEEGFRIEYSADSGFASASTTTVTIPTSNATTRTVTDLSPGEYWFRVKAYNSAGDSEPSNVVTVTIIDTDAPVAPSDLEARAGQINTEDPNGDPINPETTIKVSWTDNAADEDGYRIDYVGADGTVRSVDLNPGPGRGPMWSLLAGLTPDTTYAITVTAYYEDAGEASAGPVTAMTWLVAPASGSVQYNAPNSNEADVSWQDQSATEEGFHVTAWKWADSNNDGTAEKAAAGGATTITNAEHVVVGTLEAEASYSFSVHAFHGGNRSREVVSEPRISTPPVAHNYRVVGLGSWQKRSQALFIHEGHFTFESSPTYPTVEQAIVNCVHGYVDVNQPEWLSQQQPSLHPHTYDFEPLRVPTENDPPNTTWEDFHIVGSTIFLTEDSAKTGGEPAPPGDDGWIEVLVEDSWPVVTVTPSVNPAQADEGTSSAAFTFHRSGYTTEQLTVSYTLAGEATPAGENAEVDYNSPPAGQGYGGFYWVTFGVGQSDVSVPLAANGDTLAEAPERVEVSVQAGSDYRRGNTAATYLIIDQQLSADLDVDSFNTATHAGPDRTNAEELIEDDSAKPGKVLIVNDDDTDGDGIVDFADGSNRDGQSSTTKQQLDDAVAGEKFVPIVAQRPAGATKVRITYSGSDPAASFSMITLAGQAPNQWYALDGSCGPLRLWKKNGDQQRNAAGIASGGDYVAPNIPSNCLPLPKTLCGREQQWALLRRGS